MTNLLPVRSLQAGDEHLLPVHEADQSHTKGHAVSCTRENIESIMQWPLSVSDHLQPISINFLHITYYFIHLCLKSPYAPLF